MAFDLRNVVSGKVLCPFHDDLVGSLAVYHDHLYCHACKRFVRQQAGLALLLGKWDGNPHTELDAVRRVRPLIPQYSNPYRPTPSPNPSKQPVLDPTLPETFMRYLFSSGRQSKLMQWRGYSLGTIRKYVLGHTGTHWSIPVYDADGVLVSMRFRVDSRYSHGESKYSAISGFNPTVLYPLWAVVPCDTVWLVEGEYDSITVNEWGACCLTVTNGAGQLPKLPSLLSTVGWARGVREWILATDQDEAGERAAHELRKGLGVRCRRAQWASGKDLTEFVVAGGTLREVSLDNLR